MTAQQIPGEVTHHPESGRLNQPVHPGGASVTQFPIGPSPRHRGVLCQTLLGLLCLGMGWLQPNLALAWNDFGHMTVAAVAWQHLTPTARRQATMLLRLNPDYARWISRAPRHERDVMAFLLASTWADAIKHETGYIDDGERPAGPDANSNIGYEDRNEHRYWHYVDIPFSPDRTPLPAVPTPNAATRIADFRRVLADPGAPAAVRSYDLVWLLHLVGDIHQPLHAVSRFTRELPEGDQGGNRIRLCTPPCRQELHAFWDDTLGRGSPARALVVASGLPRPAIHLASDRHIEHWVAESGRIARRVVYAIPIGEGAGPYPLTRAYREQAHSAARARVALAGRRLAVLLNHALKMKESPAPGGFPQAPPESGPSP